MSRKESRFTWYLKNIRNLIIVCIRIFLHCILHPKDFSKLFFSIFSTINAFYQAYFGKLKDFYETKTAKALKERLILAKCNYFNIDQRVTRSNEIQILSNLVAFLNPKTVFEIGTYNGFTSLHFAENTPDDAVIYTLDLPQDFILDDQNKENLSSYTYDDLLVIKLSKETIGNRIYKNTACAHKIRELFGDSKTFDFSPYHKKMDLIFIVGNHSYPYVKSDTENAFKMLSDSGVIIWHDFDYIIHRSIFKYLNQLSKKYSIYSIPHTRFAILGNASTS